jgi:hypothetical protein
MPRKTLKQRSGKYPTDTDSKYNRVRGVIRNLIGNEDPDRIMRELLDVIPETGKIPQVGKYYIFIYQPKTPNIQYDQNPFVAVTDVYQWGFKGINFHWREMRQYTFDEMPGGIHQVYPSEIKDLQALPFQNIRLNN